MHTTFLLKENLNRNVSQLQYLKDYFGGLGEKKKSNLLSQHVGFVMLYIALLYGADIGVSLPLMPWFLYADRDIRNFVKILQFGLAKYKIMVTSMQLKNVVYLF